MILRTRQDDCIQTMPRAVSGPFPRRTGPVGSEDLSGGYSRFRLCLCSVAGYAGIASSQPSREIYYKQQRTVSEGCWPDVKSKKSYSTVIVTALHSSLLNRLCLTVVFSISCVGIAIVREI
jgi:hypothetical protein